MRFKTLRARPETRLDQQLSVFQIEKKAVDPRDTKWEDGRTENPSVKDDWDSPHACLPARFPSALALCRGAERTEFRVKIAP